MFKTFCFTSLPIFIQQLAMTCTYNKKIFTYFALPNTVKSSPPTSEVIEDSYCIYFLSKRYFKLIKIPKIHVK
jgi:hypothetical protein